METHPGQKLFRKILEFFHLSFSTSKPVTDAHKRRRRVENLTLPLYSPVADERSSHNIVTQKTSVADSPPEYSATSIRLERCNVSSKELEDRIVQLWGKVWAGLYQTNQNEEIFHYRRLEALRTGAGLTGCRTGKLLPLYWYYFSQLRDLPNGVAGLKLYTDLPIRTLQSVLDILKAYEAEIPNLHRLYEILQGAQTDLYQPTTMGSKRDGQKRESIKRQYLEIAEPMEKRLAHYDVRMDVLTIQIHDEARALHGDSYRQRGQHVYRKVFPIGY